MKRPVPSTKNTNIRARKQPLQARSNQLVADILEAAVRVLKRDGAHGFTTTRVAEAAGVSVGSLYQYFPNKQSILFRLQSDEWQTTGDMLQNILADETLPPLDRLRAVVREFFLSEFDEAELRVALGDAAPHYRDAPETAQQRRSKKRQLVEFMKEILPNASTQTRSLTADLIVTSMTAVGKKVSEQGRTRAEIAAFAAGMAAMYCAHLERLSTS